MPEGKSERKITAKKSQQSSFPKSALKQIKLPFAKISSYGTIHGEMDRSLYVG